MFEDKIREILKPTLEEVYKQGFTDGARHTLNMYRYGWENGHADTMAALGEIDIHELDEAFARQIFEDKGFERVKRSEVGA